MVDGLLYNEVVESTVHSTDTHGFSGVNFAVTYRLGVTFAPRIQSFQDQQLSTFVGIDVPGLAVYALRLGKPLERGLIEA